MGEDRCFIGDPVPRPDIAVCSNCRWRGDINKCEGDEVGDEDSGYYFAHFCPECDEEIADYTMSEDRHNEWWAWVKRTPCALV